MERSLASGLLPTTPMVCAVIYDPTMVDNPDIPSYQLHVYGRCDPPALIPLQMKGIEVQVDCHVGIAVITVRGRLRVHCVMGSRSCDCRLVVPTSDQLLFAFSVKLEQGTVTTLLEESRIVKGVSYKTGAGEERKAYAPLTVVCDGCFSNLQRTLCTPTVQVDVPSCFVALVLENCHLPYPNHGHVVIADPSPILFYPISSTEVRSLVDVPGKKLPPIANEEMANYLRTVVEP